MTSGSKSTEILGEALGHVSALQRNERVGLTGAAQRRGQPLLRSPQRHRLGGPLEFDFEFADDTTHGSVDAAGQPAGQNIKRGFVL